MDPSSLLEQTVQDVSNLQSEFHYILEEIKSNDVQQYDVKRKYLQLDNNIHKHIKQNGSLIPVPNEEDIYSKIKESMEEARDIQKDKCILSNTVLFLVSKHLAKLEKNIEILEEDGLLAPLEEDVDSGNEATRASSVNSTNSEKKRKAVSPAEAASDKQNFKKRKQHSRASSGKPEGTKSVSIKVGSTPVHTADGDGNYGLQDLGDDLFSAYNNNEDEEDKTLYCFCRSVSYGEMVACDGPNCKYEWFHYSCVNLREPPKGTWFCPDCTQELAKNTLKRKRV